MNTIKHRLLLPGVSEKISSTENLQKPSAEFSGMLGIEQIHPRPNYLKFTKSSQNPHKPANMEREITALMESLGIRRDQAVHMLRQRAELARSGYRGNSNWLK